MSSSSSPFIQEVEKSKDFDISNSGEESRYSTIALVFAIIAIIILLYYSIDMLCNKCNKVRCALLKKSMFYAQQAIILFMTHNSIVNHLVVL